MDFVFFLSLSNFLFIELIKTEMAKAEPERILHCHIFWILIDFPALITSNGTGFTFHGICHVIFIYHNQYRYDK